MRKVHFSDGSTVSSGFTSEKESYEIYPNTICIVEPYNPRNKANGHRGRICEFTGESRMRRDRFLAQVVFMDEKGGYGYIDPTELKPNLNS